MTHRPESIYRLRLYIAGLSERSSRAVVNLRRLCEEHLPECYELQVIDISSQPLLARSEQLVAVPTLVKEAPLPSRRFVGDMSNTDSLLRGLGLPSVAVNPRPAVARAPLR